MNARARAARRTIRQRATANRAHARIARRGNASLTTHAIAAGLPTRAARSVASTLRKTATELGVTGTQHRVHAGRRMRTTTRYTPAQVAVLAAAYQPRKPAYKVAAARLALAA
ncbi:hypothetical protein [Streptomyces sp. NPDC019937]|uniref:hypothetical protein n=1 Tax=Streptomyces sp. NPDC019937 TaxID=3154787 RepID=UPI0033C7FE95